jgi:hypothetical protein
MAQAGQPLPSRLSALADFAVLPVEETYTNKDLDKALKSVSSSLYDSMVCAALLQLGGQWSLSLPSCAAHISSDPASAAAVPTEFLFIF